MAELAAMVDAMFCAGSAGGGARSAKVASACDFDISFLGFIFLWLTFALARRARFFAGGAVASPFVFFFFVVVAGAAAASDLAVSCVRFLLDLLARLRVLALALLFGLDVPLADAAPDIAGWCV